MNTKLINAIITSHQTLGLATAAIAARKAGTAGPGLPVCPALAANPHAGCAGENPNRSSSSEPIPHEHRRRN